MPENARKPRSDSGRPVPPATRYLRVFPYFREGHAPAAEERKIAPPVSPACPSPMSGFLSSAFLLILAACLCASELPAQVSVRVDWNHPDSQVKTTLTIQECPEPPLMPGHSVHSAAMARLRELKADMARIQFWHPYPRLGVPELLPPSGGRTYWDFRLPDQALLDFYRAAEGRPVMLNFSTVPDWMLKTWAPVTVSDNPDAIDWNYNQGRALRDPSLKELTEYYRRIAEWYIRGGFRDEAGTAHVSGHHLKFAYWEVLNEIDEEHMWSPEAYTRIYDAVVSAVKPVDPAMRFSALALANPAAHLDHFRYFLNPSNHRPGTPLDMVSYHFYIAANPGEDLDSLQELFYQRAGGVLDTVSQIEAIRKQLSPATKTYINELGFMWMDGKKVDQQPIPDRFWTLSSAVFAYTYLGLVRQGIDFVASAELIDYPGQYAGSSLLDWTSGQPFARYYVTRELIRDVRAGDILCPTQVTGGAVAAQGFVSDRGRLIVLVNKLHTPQRVTIQGAKGMRALAVTDTRSAPRSLRFSGASLILAPDAVVFASGPR